MMKLTAKYGEIDSTGEDGEASAWMGATGDGWNRGRGKVAVSAPPV